MLPRFVVLSAFLAVACGGATPKSSQPERRPTASAPLPPQASYCQKLSPLLEQSTKAADIGAKLACLDVPGVTELGRFGGGTNAEEESLANCFERQEDFASVVAMPEGTLELRLDDEFVSETSANAGARLGDLVPWLPSVSLGNAQARRVRARVSIEDARFVTLVGVASKLQGQPREAACLQALCTPGTTYVSKALIGTPKVVLSAEDENGQSAQVGAVIGSAGFSEKQLDQGRRELSSLRPVTLAIARTSFRTPQTEGCVGSAAEKGRHAARKGRAVTAGSAVSTLSASRSVVLVSRVTATAAWRAALACRVVARPAVGAPAPSAARGTGALTSCVVSPTRRISTKSASPAMTSWPKVAFSGPTKTAC